MRLNGKLALGPDGKRFASVFQDGLYTAGVTPLGAWLDSPAEPPSATSAARVVRAVCANEGGLEAINSYDDCHLSFGIFQWTAGADDDPGELPSVMSDFKKADGAAFQDCIGRYGLDVIAPPGDTRTGTPSVWMACSWPPLPTRRSCAGPSGATGSGAQGIIARCAWRSWLKPRGG